MALSSKQIAFIDEYLICLNSAEAARRAGYSEKTARSIGSENLTKPNIQAEITRRLKERHLSADAVLARLADMALSNLSDFADIQTSADLANARERGHVIKKFKSEIIMDQLGRQHEKIEIELYDAQAALVHIGKAHGIFKETTTNLNLDLSQLTNEQLQRIAAGEDASTVLATTQSSG